MTPISKEKTIFSPALAGLLPIFYIGWSDSVLSPSEIDLIHSRIRSMSFLSKEERQYLIKWTNPKNPPHQGIFKEWVKAIKLHAGNISSIEKKSIADLCYHIVTSMVEEEENLKNRPLVRQAIIDMEKALGLDNKASLRLLLDRIDAGQISQNEEAGFDIKIMETALDGEYRETKLRMRKLLQDPFFKYKELRLKEDYRQAILEWTKALANQGLGAYSFPKKYGGGGKIGDHMAVFEMLAYHDLSLTVKFGVQFGLFGGAIFGLGTSYHHNLYIHLLSNAELLGCFAMTETGHGSNVKGIETTAIYDKSSDSITINTPHHGAAKEYIGNALHSTMGAVFAQLYVKGLNHGVHAILVPLRNKKGMLMEGVEVKDNGYKMGLNGVDNGMIWFSNVQVPRKNLLNKYGGIDDDGQYQSGIENPNKRFFTMLGALVTGRISVGQAGINVSKSALSIAIKYATKRRQFDSKETNKEILIIDYPTHQRRLLPLLAKTYAYDISLSRLARDHASSHASNRRKIETQAAGLKSMATWHNTFTVQECREACGGKGFLTENRLPDLKADSDVFTTFEGDNTVLMQLVAKGLLTEYKQSFHDEGFWAVARHLRSKITNTIAEYNPFYSRLTTTDHLLDRNFHNHALRYREKKLLISVASRMQDYLKKRIHPHDAFLKCQVHMIDLAKAYVERLAYKDFILFIENSEESIKPILTKVANLYALSIIEADKGWYLETGYIEGIKTKAIRRIINKLCQELRYEACGLVDAWGIPKSLLGTKIIN